MTNQTVLSTAEARMKSIGAFKAILVTMVVGVLLTLSACKSKPTVPDYETATDQARVAQQQFQRAQQTIDEKMRREEMLRAIAGFQRVIDRFPQDRVFTPVSYLMIADIHFELRDYRKAETGYRETVRRYPDIRDVHSSALYGLGETLRATNQGARSKEVFKQLIDTYQGSDDQRVRTLVSRARSRYDEIL